MKKGYELLNCDDHQRIMKKANRDFSLARPDITHQVRFRSHFPHFHDSVYTLFVKYWFISNFDSSCRLPNCRIESASCSPLLFM